jgi:hypothetical protein
VYQQVTHLIPWEFPLLLVVPAFAVDLALQRTDSWRPIARALVIGLGFLGIFVAVQWPFADFLLSPHARNYFFGAGYLGYNTQPTSPYARFVFAQARLIWRGMLVAAAFRLRRWASVGRSPCNEETMTRPAAASPACSSRSHSERAWPPMSAAPMSSSTVRLVRIACS